LIIFIKYDQIETESAQKFLTSLQAKLGEFMGSIGTAFKDPATVSKLKDQQPHTFTIKGGQIQIN
jgi:hypothetical protein